MDDLDVIFIRVRKNNKWVSESLREILEGGHGVEIYHWFVGRVRTDFIGLQEGAIITEEYVRVMIGFLERNGAIIHRLKE